MEHMQRPRTLQEVAAFLEEDKNVGSCSLSTLEEDSRQVVKGSLFYAHKGHTVDGFDFMLKAQEQGAAAVICDCDAEPSQEQLKDVSIPVLHLKKGMTIGEFASWFYFNPSSKLRLIGITGTNGKSTVTQLIAQYFALFNRKCAVFGTLGYGFLPNLKQSSNTTLSAVALQKALAEVVKEGADYAALEVSSIGVCEGRIDGCVFSGGAFTNLTRDHLDYHKTMENYAKAKREFLNRVSELSFDAAALMLFGYGIANIFGNVLAGKLYIRRPIFYSAAVPAILLISYLMLYVSASLPAAACTLLLLVGLVAGFMVVPGQHLISSAAGHAQDFANGLFLTAANFGTMIGTALCGEFIDAAGTKSVLFGSFVMLILAVAFLWLRINKGHSQVVETHINC